MTQRPWESFDGINPPNPDVAYELARRYSIETETFDRTVCTGPMFRGEVQPVGYAQIYKISANAGRVRRILEIEARAAGLTWRDVNQAMRSYENSQQFVDDMAAIP